MDDEIYRDFRQTFGSLRVDVIDEDKLKNDKSKARWRELCMRYENSDVAVRTRRPVVWTGLPGS